MTPVSAHESRGAVRFDSVQVLRFVAAALVVLAHAESRLARVFPELATSTVVFDIGEMKRWGHVGVDLFFVISGFIMYWVSRRSFSVRGATAEFLAKRAVRIVPIYWLLTVFAVGLLAMVPSVFSYRGSCDPGWVAASLLFLPWRAPEGFISPVLGLGWTLNYEVYFYAWFAALLVLRERTAMRVITVAFVACAIAGTFVDPVVPFLRQATSWLLVEFLLGLWIGHALATRAPALRRFASWSGPLGALVLIATIFHNPVPFGADESNNNLVRFLLWGIPSAGVVAWALTTSRAPSDSVIGRGAVALGDASYSIYLLQVFALPAFGIVFRFVGVDAWLPFDLLVVALTAASLTAGYVFFVLVERPLTRTLQRKIVARATVARTAGPV